MKKFVCLLLVIGVLCVGSIAILANGPWPNPGTDTNVTTSTPK